jgi:hypothetical protein
VLQGLRDKMIFGRENNKSGREAEGIEPFWDSILGRAGFVYELIALLNLIVMAISS